MVFAGPFLAMAVLVSAAPADSLKGLEGTWQGFLNPKPQIEIRLILKVEKQADGSLKGTVESPELKSQPAVTFDQVKLGEDRSVLLANKEGWEFQAKLDPADNELKGDWKVGFVSTPLTFARVEGPVKPAEVWEGSLAVNGGIKLRLAFHVVKAKGDEIHATMDSIDQGAFAIKVTTTEIAKDSLRFSIKNMAEFQGKLDESADKAVGAWKQGGLSLPLTLRKVTEVTEVRRPQLPKAPFPYVSEDVAYDSRSKGVRIAGTLTKPEGDGPFPVALMITGSGSQDRDESLLGHKPFLVLADDLTRRGIAVLRVDDRGVGGSTGNPATSTTLDFVEDVLGGIDFLKSQKKIDAKRIGLIGHSEGGLIAPMVATRSNDIAFIVMLAGPGLPGDQILSSQASLILKASGAPEDKVREAVEAQTKLTAIAKTATDTQQALDRMKAAYAELIKSLPEEERKAIAATDPGGSQLSMLASPWFRYFLGYDPRPTLARVTCPILAINGEKDLQVPCKDNLEAIAKAVGSGAKASLTTREMAGLNHLFQTSQTGAPSEYGTIEETFAPAALKVIGEWVVEKTRR